MLRTVLLRRGSQVRVEVVRRDEAKWRRRRRPRRQEEVHARVTARQEPRGTRVTERQRRVADAAVLSTLAAEEAMHTVEGKGKATDVVDNEAREETQFEKGRGDSARNKDSVKKLGNNSGGKQDKSGSEGVP